MEIKLVKIVSGDYTVVVDGKEAGTVSKIENKWVAEMADTKVSYKSTRKEAVASLVASFVIAEEEANAGETELDKFIKKFDAYYSIHAKHKLAGTPELDYHQWFKAKYGLSEAEAEYKVRQLNKPEYAEMDSLHAWYMEYSGCADEEEARGYEQNDVDTWNDYLRDWKEVNPSLPEVAEDDDADLVFPEGKKPRTIQLNDYEGHKVAVRECLEYEDILEVLVDGENVVDLFRFVKEGEGCFEWSCYDGTYDFGIYPSPKRAIKAFLNTYFASSKLKGVSSDGIKANGHL